jgi:8-amino-7-oxononanoate synthase
VAVAMSGGIDSAASALLLQEKGFEVKAILSPTVPEGQERLRFCLHSYNTELEMKNVLDELSALIL